MIKLFRRIRRTLLSKINFTNPTSPVAKYLFYATGEIILVVIGILIALQINNWNTDRINKVRVEKYSKSLIQDLLSDIEMIDVSQRQAKECYYKIDSLKSYFLTTIPEDLSNTDLFILTKGVMYRPYKWNRSTFQEMKNSEILQYFKNDSLKKMLIAYETFSYHLDEDFKGDQSNAMRADEMVSDILDLNDPYFYEMNILEDEIFNNQSLNIFTTDEYKRSKSINLKLVSYDKVKLKKFLNTFIQIQEAYRIRAFFEMTKISKDAGEIIELLRKESQE